MKNSDALNPAFLFNMTQIELLTKIASGEINAQGLAKLELKARGLDEKGKWVGFGK